MKLDASRPVLVTGASGFVGGAIVSALASAAYRVRTLSRRDATASGLGSEHLRGDLGSRASLEKAVQGCEVVFHCAAEKNDVTLMEAVNVGGTRNLFEACRAQGVRRLCHLSSVGVIGKVVSRVIDEQTPCQPMNRYEETKLCAEAIVAQGIPNGAVSILRPTNVFGPDTVRALFHSSTASRLKQSLMARENAHFVYVKDVAAAALYLALRDDAAACDTCIVSSDEEPGNTHADILRALAVLRPGTDVMPFEMPHLVPYLIRRLRGRPSNRGDVVYSSQHLRATGFRFPFGLAGGLRDASNA